MPESEGAAPLDPMHVDDAAGCGASSVLGEVMVVAGPEYEPLSALCFGDHQALIKRSS